MFENVETKNLDKVAVDKAELASNFPDVVNDCYGIDGASVASIIQDKFPLVDWLMDTTPSREIRAELNRAQATGGCVNRFHKAQVGAPGAEVTKWVMETPRSIWTTEPTSTANECCWLPFDFAKCAGYTPINLLCLKDCGNIEDDLMGDILRYNERNSVSPIAYSGDTYNEVRRRIDRLSMLFYTAHNVIHGIDDTYTDTLKPFHGLLAVLENPAVQHVQGTNILAAFDQIGCRLDILGGDQVIAVNPVIYASIAAAIVPDQNGNLPAGWTKDGNTVRFHGRRFIQDKLVPVDTAAGKGEAWVLDGETLGMFLATDLAPTDRFVRYSGINNVDPATKCGEECMYMYNLGTVWGSDANRLAVIYDIPVQSACTSAVSDLSALVQPTTLIPRV